MNDEEILDGARGSIAEAAPVVPVRPYRAEEVAEMLAVNRNHVYEHATEIPGLIRLGRRMLWARPAVDAWLAEGDVVRGVA